MYSNAITLESKEGIPVSSNHQKNREEKKQQRLLAIDEVEKFVKGLDDSDPKFEDKCTVKLQILGRNRECSVIKQGHGLLTFSDFKKPF